MLGEIIGYGWYSYMAEVHAVPMCGFLAGGIAMFAAGQRMKRRSARIARYLAVMGERGYISCGGALHRNGQEPQKDRE